MGTHKKGARLSKSAIAALSLAVFAIAAASAVSFGKASLLAQTGSATATGLAAPVSDSELKNQQDNVKGKKDYAKNLRREIDDIRRDTKGATNTDAAVKLADAFDACILALEGYVGKDNSTFWDKNRECDDSGNALQTELQDVLRPQRDCANYKNNMVNRRWELKDQNRNVSDWKKSGIDVSAVVNKLAELESAITKLEGASGCNRDNLGDFQDLQRNVDDGFTDYYDLSRDISDKVNAAQQIKSYQQQLKDNQRNCKDKAREFKNFEREYNKAKQVPGAKEGYEKVAALHNEFCVQGLAAKEQALQSGDVDAMQDVFQGGDDRDFWDTMNETRQLFNQVQQLKDLERNLKDVQRNCKDKDREYKRAVKEGRNTAKLDEAYKIVGCEGEMFVKLKAAIASGDPQNYWDVQNEYQEWDRTFWDANNESSFIGDYTRRLKDTKRECEDREREAKRFKREVSQNGADVDVAALNEIVTACKNIYAEAQTAGQNKDFEALRVLLEERMQTEVREGWDEAMSSFNEMRELKFIKNELSNVRREIDNGKKLLDGMINRKQISGERVDICNNLIGEAESLYSEAQQAAQNNDGESLKEIMMNFEEFGYNVDTKCPELADHGPINYEEVMQQNFRGNFEQDISEKILQRVLEKMNQDLVSQVVGQLTTKVSSSLLESLLSKVESNLNESLQNHLAGILENTVYLGDKAENVIQIKSDFYEIEKYLKEIASRKGGEALQKFIAEVETSTVVGETAENLKKLTTDFIENAVNASGGTLTSLVNKFIGDARRLLGGANEEAWRTGYIPCKDTAMDQWYTKYAAELMEAGIIQGKLDANGNPTGECAPGSNVKIIEVIKMIFAMGGEDQSELSGAPRGVKCAPWAAGYCAYFENRGTFLTSRFKDWNVEAPRSTVVRLILETLGVEPTTPEKPSFSDVKTSHPDYAFVETAKTLKLVSGDKGKGTFRPDDLVKRGEMFRIIKNAMVLRNSLSQTEEF